MRNIKIVLRLLLLLLVLYSFLRICFWSTYFSGGINMSILARISYWGLRLDLSAVILVNIPLILFLLFVEPFISNRRQRNFISILLLLLLNLPFLALNIIDLAYFRFNLRRSTVDFFGVIGGAEQAFGTFFFQYWYLLLLFLGLSWLIGLAGRRIIEGKLQQSERPAGGLKPINWFVNIAVLAFFGLLIRGWNARPLTPSTPLLYLPAQYQPLTENSAITFIYSLLRNQTSLEEKQYFSASTLDSLFTIRRQYSSSIPFERKNVVVFVLESFSKNLLDPHSPLKAKTPFLDSLMKKSIVCHNAFANGLESNKGLVALLAGLPPLMDEAYYYSSYSSNPFIGIGTILKEEGYSTNFFMGASPDHFGFGKLCKLTGIDRYYSEREYGNPKDHDGSWGIYDHKFFSYAASILKGQRGPSFSVIFNISSHHPFRLPDDLKRQFTLPGQNAQQNSISYVDYSLKEFFGEAKLSDWYKSSIFLFVADHAITWDIKPRKALYTAFEIPFFVYEPGHDPAEINKTVQQLDLVPTIFDMLHYKRPFMSFGRSIFDNTDGFAINKIFGNYQMVQGGVLLGYNEKEERPYYLYDFKNDSELRYNLISDSGAREEQQAELKLKAVLQQFNNSLISHRLLIDR